MIWGIALLRAEETFSESWATDFVFVFSSSFWLIDSSLIWASSPSPLTSAERSSERREVNTLVSRLLLELFSPRSEERDKSVVLESEKFWETISCRLSKVWNQKQKFKGKCMLKSYQMLHQKDWLLTLSSFVASVARLASKLALWVELEASSLLK